MDVHLIDGTYELFRHFFAVPAVADGNGQEIGALRGVLHSVFSMIERGATHIGVPITLWNRFATICTRTTKPAKACLRNCSRSFRFSKKRSKLWE
jgi:hypothetical protein